MLEILKKLCGIPSAPGAESEMLSFIQGFCKGGACRFDGMGNLIIEKKCGRENAGKLMLCAGADSDGYIVNFIEENGYLRISKLGNPNCISAAYGKCIVGNGVRGVVVPEKGASVTDGDSSKLYVDIGAQSRVEAEKYIKLSDVCCVIPDMTELCADRYAGCGIGVRLSAAVLLDIFRKTENADCDLYFCFNVQESLQKRGAKTVAFDISPDACLCVDVCESLDTIGANRRGEAVLGDGAVVLAKTKDYCADPILRKTIEETAAKAGIKHKTCVYAEKTTAASAISNCGKGVPCVSVCVPVRNMETGAEIFQKSDAESIGTLICEVIKTF